MNNTFPYSEARASLSERAITLQDALSPDIRPETFPSHVARSSSDSQLTSSDKLSALPDSSLTRPRIVRVERQSIQASQSVPSLGNFMGHPDTSTPDHDMPKATITIPEGSIGKGSPFQRVSFESGPSRIPSPPSNNSRSGNNVHHPLLRDGGALPSRSPLIESALSRFRRPSDPPRPSSAMRAGAQTPRKGSYESPSASQSRAASPMRMFASWTGFHRKETREEPFVPQNPFQRRNPLRRFSIGSPEIHNDQSFDPNCEDSLKQCLPRPITCSPLKSSRRFLRSSRYFLMDTLPRQIYLHLLFRLPSLYFSRIARIYEDAELSRPDIQRLVDACAPQLQNHNSSHVPPGAHYHPQPTLPLADEWTIANVSPALIRFKHSWEAFIDSLLREWKTLNLVSALLLSAILSMFQNVVMAQDPVIRTAALLSLTSALMSLTFGCIYIVRFGTMRSMYKATRWAEEARKTTTFIWWNVWVLLAMPAVWLAWSMFFFIVAILSFVWRSDSSADNPSPAPLSPYAILGPRIAITSLFIVGLIDFMLIIKTLHNYARTRDVDGEMQLLGTDDSSRARPSADREREDRGRRAGHLSRGRARFTGEGRGRLDRDRPDGGALSAVTGLGLTNLDDALHSSPRSSNELSREKDKTMVIVATND